MQISLYISRDGNRIQVFDMGVSIIDIGIFDILAQDTNATNSTNATNVNGVEGIPVTYPLESFSTTY
ncbi:MAG: hypothetical protein ACXWFZ_13745, partial [Nitrososphaeraceae archaeon]